jgi:hypothetical protein
MCSLTFIIVLTVMLVTGSSKASAAASAKSTEASSGAIQADNSYALLSDPVKGTANEKVVKALPDSASNPELIKSVDTTRYNMFGDLLIDDPLFNKKNPLWRPIIGILEVHTALGLYNRYVANEDFGRVGFNSWKHNIKTGWEWDNDRFGMNFLAHPYSGGLHFMSARSNGYSYWESMPFAAGGSLMWEYLGENTLPSYNDIINTTISGAFYGEVLYRLSSNVLDDRTTGTERFFREFSAAVLSPTRFINRLVDGKLTRVTSEEVYQKEPLNVEIAAGVRKLNDGSSFGTGPQNAMSAVQFDYGYPFEKREWKPFDFFTIHAGVNVGVGRKYIENVIGYGVLYGKTIQYGKLETLMGIFQHYDYLDNKTFELGSIAVGGGIMSKYPVTKESYFFTNFHLGIVPLVGNSTRLGPDTSQVRDYTYNGGLESKLESGLNLGWGSIQLNGYYYWLKTYVGPVGTNSIAILRPRITIRLYRNLNMGFEELAYYSSRNTANLGSFQDVRTEQRIYLMLNVGNFKL